MRTFDIYENSNGSIEAVKQGFSWPAFFFGAIWAFVKGLVGVGFILIFLFAMLKFLEVAAITSNNPGALIFLAIVYFIIPVVIGFNGNNWRRTKLLEKNFKHTKSIEAAFPEAAIKDSKSSNQETEKSTEVVVDGDTSAA